MSKSKKQDEYDEAVLELYLLFKILTNKCYARALEKEIEIYGNFATDIMRVLQGKEPERKWLE